MTTFDDALESLLAVQPGPGYHQGAAMVAQRHPTRKQYIDREVGLRATAEYVRATMPDLADRGGWTVLDIGPGSGHWLEFARELGHDVAGIDCLDTESALVQGYAKMTRAVGLAVVYMGFHGVVLAHLDGSPARGDYDMIHSRASLGGVLASAFPGRRDPQRVLPFLDCCRSMLRDGGILHVHHSVWDGLEEMIEVMKTAPGLSFERVDKITTRHRRIDHEEDGIR